MRVIAVAIASRDLPPGACGSIDIPQATVVSRAHVDADCPAEVPSRIQIIAWSLTWADCQAGR